MKPARAMVINIPAECFSLDAVYMNGWQTPNKNSIRAASIAALVGLISTPLSKGWVSGNHEELAREEVDGAERDSSKKKEIHRVHRHMMPSGDKMSSLPMFVTAYEELYDAECATVVAIRLWHLVFDPGHSTSYLARKLMDETLDERDHAGQAHCPNS